MRYSIGQVAKKLGLTAHTLRYYDKEGLLPFVRKGSSGARVFEDEDVDWLIIIECLKGTGMQLKDIKKYLDNEAIFVSSKVVLFWDYIKLKFNMQPIFVLFILLPFL